MCAFCVAKLEEVDRNSRIGDIMEDAYLRLE